MKWRERINKKYLQISLYVIVTVVIIYALSLIVKNFPAIATEVMVRLKWFIKVIKPLIIGFVFAYLMDPLVGFFEHKYKHLKNKKWLKKFIMPRTLATFTSVMLLIIAVLGLISLLVFTVTNQLRLANLDDIVELAQVYLNNLKELYTSISNRLKELDIQSREFELYVKQATDFILGALMNFANATINSFTNISGSLTTLIFSFIIGCYFMIDGRMFLSYIKKVCKALFPGNVNQKMTGMVHDLDEVFSGYIRGQLIDAFIMMILISLVLSIIGVKFAIVIGICAGIANLIPYFGPVVAYVSSILVCLINGEMKTLIVALIALFLIQTIDGNLIGPKLLSKSIKIHPLIIIVSLIFGSALGGFLGMLLAVPVGAYIKLVFVRFIDQRLEEKKG